MLPCTLRVCSPLPTQQIVLADADCFLPVERQRFSPHPVAHVSVPPTPPLRPDSAAFQRSSRSPPLSIGSAAATPSSPPLYTHHQPPPPSLLATYRRPSPSGAPHYTHHPSPPYSSPALSASSYPPRPPADMNPYYFHGGQSHHHHHRDSNSSSSSSSSSSNVVIPPLSSTASPSSYVPPAVHVTTPTAPAYYYAPGSGPYHSHERYICRVCNKAFSRPSSLRIHSHSHTGEKPFKCAYEGCGKSFSVRSNMKRHERGCHPRSSVSLML